MLLRSSDCCCPNLEHLHVEQCAAAGPPAASAAPEACGARRLFHSTGGDWPGVLLLLELLGMVPSRPLDVHRQDGGIRDLLYDATRSQGTGHLRSSDKSRPQYNCNT